ncbi:MAG: cysteine desulfurase [FCB group bacterium]|nr:cysteine desulfurase [FCB group bacterium]
MRAAKLREDFPLLSSSQEQGPLIYLDSAATTLKPRCVIDAMVRYYTEYGGSVHRGIYRIAEQATAEYENTRREVASFIGAETTDSIIFTKGTTESINLVAYAWARNTLKPGDEILITEMEHHSNIVPWQMVAKSTGALIRYLPLNSDGTLDLNRSEQYFTPHTKLVAVIHQSNVLGTVNPVKEIVKLAHDAGAVILVDGAQRVPHHSVNVTDLGADFYVFSGHKMLGPTGVGVLYGNLEILDKMEPFHGGGDMIRTVSMNASTWNALPYKFEAGTPPIAQVIGLGAAVKYLSDIGLDRIAAYETQLTAYALKTLREIPDIEIYGDARERGAVISFNAGSVHPHDLSQLLDQDGIAVRAGHHCAQPIMTRLGISATTRASFYLYNTFEEIDLLGESIRKAITFMGG